MTAPSPYVGSRKSAEKAEVIRVRVGAVIEPTFLGTYVVIATYVSGPRPVYTPCASVTDYSHLWLPKQKRGIVQHDRYSNIEA